jgi:5-bromo-4-chloroindolyl phosphate hydrolysis protein
MTIEHAIAMLSVSAPITVAIIKMVPRRAVPENGISEREFRQFASFVRQNLNEMREDIRELRRRK